MSIQIIATGAIQRYYSKFKTLHWPSYIFTQTQKRKYKFLKHLDGRITLCTKIEKPRADYRE